MILRTSVKKRRLNMTSKLIVFTFLFMISMNVLGQKVSYFEFDTGYDLFLISDFKIKENGFFNYSFKGNLLFEYQKNRYNYTWGVGIIKHNLYYRSVLNGFLRRYYSSYISAMVPFRFGVRKNQLVYNFTCDANLFLYCMESRVIKNYETRELESVSSDNGFIMIPYSNLGFSVDYNLSDKMFFHWGIGCDFLYFPIIRGFLIKPFNINFFAGIKVKLNE
ncbi:MAG: hypothetical protein PHW83_10725 [Bacteroidales bacterium]|nr:hypothetical protein [Bacteroidales bacterium]